MMAFIALSLVGAVLLYNFSPDIKEIIANYFDKKIKNSPTSSKKNLYMILSYIFANQLNTLYIIFVCLGVFIIYHVR